jgi:hypothetical protein
LFKKKTGAVMVNPRLNNITTPGLLLMRKNKLKTKNPKLIIFYNHYFKSLIIYPPTSFSGILTNSIP